MWKETCVKRDLPRVILCNIVVTPWIARHGLYIFGNQQQKHFSDSDALDLYKWEGWCGYFGWDFHVVIWRNQLNDPESFRTKTDMKVVERWSYINNNLDNCNDYYLNVTTSHVATYKVLSYDYKQERMFIKLWRNVLCLLTHDRTGHALLKYKINVWFGSQSRHRNVHYVFLVLNWSVKFFMYLFFLFKGLNPCAAQSNWCM